MAWTASRVVRHLPFEPFLDQWRVNARFVVVCPRWINLLRLEPGFERA
jgi:hypothetical protein